MPEPPDPGSIWRNQPEEHMKINLERLTSRRIRDLRSATATEILISLGATIFFLSVAVWKMPVETGPYFHLGLAAAVLWSVGAAFLFSKRRRGAKPGEIAASGLDHYREVVRDRRDHLRNAWVWHGPLIISCWLLLAIGVQHLDLSGEQLRNVAPFTALLVLWTVFGVVRRYAQANELDRELRELDQQ